MASGTLGKKSIEMATTTSLTLSLEMAWEASVLVESEKSVTV
jgi:hypothetical protein